jgi:hypothetical protein
VAPTGGEQSCGFSTPATLEVTRPCEPVQRSSILRLGGANVAAVEWLEGDGTGDSHAPPPAVGLPVLSVRHEGLSRSSTWNVAVAVRRSGHAAGGGPVPVAPAGCPTMGWSSKECSSPRPGAHLTPGLRTLRPQPPRRQRTGSVEPSSAAFRRDQRYEPTRRLCHGSRAMP